MRRDRTLPRSAHPSTEARAHFDATRWGSTPALETIDVLKNSFAFKLNFDAEDDPKGLIRIKDPAAIAQLGREETLELDLRGKHIHHLRGDPFRALLPLASRLASLFSQPRRAYRLKLSADQARGLALCDVVTFTNPHAKGPQDSFGVENLAGRIIRLRLDHWTGEAEALVLTYGGLRSGWAPSAQVTEVVDAYTVKVALHAFGPEEHPFTREAQDDLSPFVEGHLVRGVAELDSGVRHTLEIADVDHELGRLTFAQAHPWAAGALGWVQPADYAQASAAHRLYAYFGSNIEVG